MDKSTVKLLIHRQVSHGFTLVELLVVVTIIALLIGMLMPGLRGARLQARRVRAHSDLRQITIALEQYALENRDQLPPARRACGTDINYQLPVELAEQGHLPPSDSKIPQADMPDIFAPDHTYRYRAPGPVYFNGTLFDFPKSKWRPRAKIWVPDDFPACRDSTGRYYADFDDEPASPVRFAVWSVGPKPNSPKFPRYEGFNEIDESTFPLPRAYWWERGPDGGLLVHFKSRGGLTHLSP